MADILFVLAIAAAVVGVSAFAVPVFTRRGYRLPLGGLFSGSHHGTPSRERQRLAATSTIASAPPPLVAKPDASEQKDSQPTPVSEARDAGLVQGAESPSELAQAASTTSAAVPPDSDNETQQAMADNTAAEPGPDTDETGARAEPPTKPAASKTLDDLMAEVRALRELLDNNTAA